LPASTDPAAPPLPSADVDERHSHSTVATDMSQGAAEALFSSGAQALTSARHAFIVHPGWALA
jgi:hypothetical protein